MENLIKCGACGKNIDVNNEPFINLVFPKNTPKAWESYFHFPDCFADFVKVAAQQSAQRTAENVGKKDDLPPGIALPDWVIDKSRRR